MLWLLLCPLLLRRRGYVSLLHPSIMKKIPKVRLKKLIHVPGRNQPPMSRDFRGENPGWEKVYKVSTTHHIPSTLPKECWWQDKPSKTFPAPFLCMILVEAETHTGEKGRRETVVGEGEETGRVPPARAGSELSRSGEGKKFWLKTQLFYYYTHPDIPMIETKLSGRWKWPEIFSRGSSITSPRGCSCIFYAGKKGLQKIYITELVGKYLQLSRQKTYSDSHYAFSQALLRVDRLD